MRRRQDTGAARPVPVSGSIARVGGEWVADSPMGKVKVRLTPPNALGVLDHDVVLESGESVHNPMRVDSDRGRGVSACAEALAARSAYE